MVLWNRVLVGVDDGPQSLNAVRYLAGVLGGSNTCKVCLLAVYASESTDSHPDPAVRQDQDSDRRLALQMRLSEAHRILIEARLTAENVSAEMIEIAGGGVGQAIMDYQRQGGYGTVVVGRRNISKAEEFLFGSTSSNVMHQANDCCVWVVA